MKPPRIAAHAVIFLAVMHWQMGVAWAGNTGSPVIEPPVPPAGRIDGIIDPRLLPIGYSGKEKLHVTKVRGAKRLPYHYEVWQKEGYRYRAHRVIEYDQETGAIRSVKKDTLEGECRVPVRINTKLIIGSLTADLAEYENPACTRYPAVSKK
jgi:hypothetical protein